METKNIPREHYLDLLRSSRDIPFIKVITGMRRCGKSTLMEMFRDEIISSGISPEKTVLINLGDETECTIRTYRELIDTVKISINPGKGTYVFLDEVQNVPEWEKVAESLYIAGSDIYITGSNSKMLSSEISTKLSGRSIEIHVLPLSFNEYLLFRESFGPEASTEVKFNEYIRWGGLPAVAVMAGERRDLISMMLAGTYNTVYVKDVVERREIRNARLLSNISRFLMKNIGDRTSVRSASRYLTSMGMKTAVYTVDSYIGFLEEALLFYRAKRFDTKTKEYLRTSDKFYVTDLGIRNDQVGFSERDIDGMLENIVFMELMHRCGNASVCAVDDYEVDFMCIDAEGRQSYYQVSMSISDAVTRERELRPLRMITDNYPKTVITYDRFPMTDIDGIRVVNIIDFLTE